MRCGLTQAFACCSTRRCLGHSLSTANSARVTIPVSGLDGDGCGRQLAPIHSTPRFYPGLYGLISGTVQAKQPSV